MIRNSFSFLEGITEKFERSLWKRGILLWEDFCNYDRISGIEPERKRFYDRQLTEMIKELKKGNSVFFTSILKKHEHWKLFEEFKSDTICLDIETNGLPFNYGGHITLIGLYDGYEWRYLLREENLTSENLQKLLHGYKYLITFNGTAFDIPFLINSFPEIEIKIPHFDLCLAAKRVGIKGGMKKIEEIFGLSREPSVKGLNGYDAVKLWKNFQKGSLEAKELLLTYNRYDTVNLFRLGELLYIKLRENSGIDKYLSQKDA